MDEELETSSLVDLYREAEGFITGLIMGPPSPAPGSTAADIRQRAIDRINRLKAFLEFLGNPHLQYPTIHIGGTSGKGSTTSITASILAASGLKTGSHVSPYLQVSTEKLLINGLPATAVRYSQLVAFMRERVSEWEARGNEMPTYGELWVAMTFVYFAHAQVDIAVIEVGAGGRFDLTNVIQPEVAAITSVGYDHTATLGNTLPEIAWHKAGIIKSGAAAITTVTDPEALPVIQAEADVTGVRLKALAEGVDWTDVSVDSGSTSFTDTAIGARFTVPLIGHFQAANASLAIAICRALGRMDLTPETILAGLSATRFPGRMETVQESPLVVLDGAHNPEKMGGLVSTIRKVTGDRNIIVVFGVLESKEYADMWGLLRPLASRLIATAPRVQAKPPVSADTIAGLAGDDLPAEAFDNPLDAIERALEVAGPDDAVLVTGSLYLVGNVREHWFPTERILEQGTLWPE